ncbi:MAG: hydantoinase/oxoprolinase family protein [Rhodospirillaceae bacterium]|nr:hydantoinase/oxoprolinase family protein [Rhodospirillaceae bacterium]
MSLFVGTDIGGTFTDLVGYDSASNRLVFGKTLTNYGDLVAGVAACLESARIEPRAVAVLKHGTTQVINTLLERKGAKTALVTTKGFADILEIGRAGRPLPYDLDYARHPPLVPRPWRLEVSERMDAQGTVLVPLALDELEELAAKIEAGGIAALAIAFLNSYRNPAHEEEAARFFRERLPGLYVTAATELSREWFEYERTSTAVANAYVGPRASTYLQRFGDSMAAQGFAGHLLFMGSNGGTLSPRRAREQPLTLVESGPIGGCIGAAAYAKALGIGRMIAFDMGGTTAKCALVEDFRFDVHGTYHVGSYEYGFPIQTPVLDIVEVGTGGGSIARVDELGRLHVGPVSAGSDPGPVCFGRGGREPTVTDANLVLDRIGSGTFLGGSLKLDRGAAIQALVEKVGDRLGFERGGVPDREAAGVIALANVQMASAIKEITIERGKDIRDFALFVFGGGGPLHGISLARELRIGRVIVPPEPGNFSALGMLLADARADETYTFLADLGSATIDLLGRATADLKARLSETLVRDFGDAERSFVFHADMRYKGQRHPTRIQVVPGDDDAALRRKFLEAYRLRYGRADDEGTIEFTGLRATAIAVAERPALDRLHRAGTAGSTAPTGYRNVFFADAGRRLQTPIYLRYGLPIGSRIEGPAVVEEHGATTVIGPGDCLEVGIFGEMNIQVRPTA